MRVDVLGLGGGAVAAVATAHVVLVLLVQAVQATLLPTSNTAIFNGNRNGPKDIQFCQPLDQQKNVNLEALAGYWYAVETIGHRDEDRQTQSYQEISLCPVMFLSQIYNASDQLRLLWEEPLGKIEYRFGLVDQNDPGFWISMGSQNGSLTNNQEYPYQQFAGTVQVMRAVGTDMVLTFCSPGSHHYSMVMSRNKTMDDRGLHSLNQMLQDRGLRLVNTRVACRGGANGGSQASVGLGLAAALLLLLLRRD